MVTRTDKNKSEEYPKKSGIKILMVDNATLGQKFGFSFMVTVPKKVSGKGRIRRQFPTIEKAKQFADKQSKGARKDGEAFFNLTTKEKQEIGIGAPKLRGKGISITEAIDYALLHLKPEGGEVLLSKAIEEFQTSKRMRHDVGDIADSTLRDFLNKSDRLKIGLGHYLVHEISAAQIKEWVSSLTVGSQTKANYLSITAQVFVYAKQKRYIRENPIDDLSDNDRKELHGRLIHGGEIKILSVGEADSFINFTADEFPEFLGAVTLGLFCGIRTEELKKLTWNCVNVSEGFVTIDATIAKKRRMRHVTIPDNAQDWLACCASRKGSVAPYSGKKFEHQFRNLRLKAGFQDEAGHSIWPANGMRHSYGSYHYALHEDSAKTSKELGHKANDDDILFTHYRALAKKSEGEKFFAIKPAASAAKIVEFVG